MSNNDQNVCECVNSKSFRYFALEWLKLLRPQIKESTFNKYHNLLDGYIFPEIGDLMDASNNFPSATVAPKNTSSVGVWKEITVYVKYKVLTGSLTADTGYLLPDAIQIFMGDNKETELTSGTDYTYNATTGEFSIKENVITDTITIEAVADRVACTIEWGSLTFDLTDLSWNADTQQYEGSTYEPQKDSTGENSNYITVTNNGTIDLNVSYSYNSADEYQDINGYFTSSDNKDADAITGQKIEHNDAQNASATAWVWLSGKSTISTLPSKGSSCTYTYGTCTVNLSK